MPSPPTLALGRQECLDLLRGCRVGRVLYTDGALPAALPVYYAMDAQDNIIFRTRPGSPLEQKAADGIVGFEADFIDDESAGGWSVLANGPARLLDLRERESARALPLLTWPGDDRTVFIRIELSRLTGRWVPRRMPTTVH